MSNITFSRKNKNKPAPEFWRKLENVLLMLIIPSVVTVLMGWGFQDEAMLNKIVLLVNTLLVALIKAIGVFLANGQIYTKEMLKEDDGGGAVIPSKGF